MVEREMLALEDPPVARSHFRRHTSRAVEAAAYLEDRRCIGEPLDLRRNQPAAPVDAQLVDWRSLAIEQLLQWDLVPATQQQTVVLEEAIGSFAANTRPSYRFHAARALDFLATPLYDCGWRSLALGVAVHTDQDYPGNCRGWSLEQHAALPQLVIRECLHLASCDGVVIRSSYGRRTPATEAHHFHRVG